MRLTDEHNGLLFSLEHPAGDQSHSEEFKSESPHLSQMRLPVICFHGSGDDTHFPAWMAAVHGVAGLTTVLYYERRGIGHGKESGPPAAVHSRRRRQNHHYQQQRPSQAVEDLIDLLQALQLKGPYILLAHSYGGTISREFLQRYPDKVAGMVLAETGQETPTKYDQEQYDNQVLGSRPLSVIHANFLYHPQSTAAKATSPAGLEMQAKWAAEDARLKKAQLKLSSNARYVRIDDCGHHVVRDRPDAVVAEVEWVLENVDHDSIKGTVNTPLWAWLRRYLARIISLRPL